MIRIIIPVVLLIMFATPVLADTQDYCLNNITLVRVNQVTVYVPELGINRTINTMENFTCPYGCDIEHNICFEAPSHNWMIAILIIVGVIIGCFIIYRIFRG
jgi:hypothetical protein